MRIASFVGGLLVGYVATERLVYKCIDNAYADPEVAKKVKLDVIAGARTLGARGAAKICSLSEQKRLGISIPFLFFSLYFIRFLYTI